MEGFDLSYIKLKINLERVVAVFRGDSYELTLKKLRGRSA
jgi:hypothetical protein